MKPEPSMDLKLPLEFSYLERGGKKRRVRLEEWHEGGPYVYGRRRGCSDWRRYDKMRMWTWRNDSHLQLRHFRPRAVLAQGFLASFISRVFGMR